MNEQIKKLAKDAGVLGDWGEDVLEGRFFITGNTEQMEKFAELIVRECTSLTLDYKNSEHYRGWLDYRNEIRKHFGVEE